MTSVRLSGVLSMGTGLLMRGGGSCVATIKLILKQRSSLS